MATTKPKVSIVIPVYNVENYIERSAVSLFEQTYANIEYVFVNDCTPDSSIDILMRVMSRYPQRSSQVKIIHHQFNSGVAVSRNTALDNCTGDFVIHADSDDDIELDAIETLVNHQLRSKADIVTGLAMMHTANEHTLLPCPHYSSKEEFVIDMMQPTINHSLWNHLIRKSLYDGHNIRADRGVNCGEDCWMMTRLAYYAESFDTIDKVVYHYDCTRENSYTANNGSVINKKKLRDDIATSILIIDFFKDKEKVYFDEANRVAIKHIDLFLKKAAGARDKVLYQEMLEHLKGFDKQYWPAIKWNKSFRRIVSSNYYSLRAVLFMSRVFYSIIPPKEN